MSETFVTLFDAGYLHHGLALHASLRACLPDARLIAVAMEPHAGALLRALPRPGLEPLEVEQLGDSALTALRPLRSRAAFCWSSTPSVLLHALDRAGTGGRATYVDADLATLRSPLGILDQAGGAGAALLATPHACGPLREALFGRYCVQFLTAWDCSEARAMLHRWRSEVLKACDESPIPGRYGDQCRLDRWPHLLGEHLAEPQDPLQFAAPWNAGAGMRDAVTYHFHQWRLRPDGRWRWVRNHRLPAWTLPIYSDYQRLIEAQCLAILAVDPAWRPAMAGTDHGTVARLKASGRRLLGWEHDSPIADPALRLALGAG